MLLIFHWAICLQMKSQYSLLCGKKWVPEVILATVEPPSRLPVRGSGVFIQARVCRARQKSTGENDALAVSEALPFLEYEIARQLMLKLKVLGRNAAFSLKSEIDVGPQLLIATTTGKYHICISPHFPLLLNNSTYSFNPSQQLLHSTATPCLPQDCCKSVAILPCTTMRISNL